MDTNIVQELFSELALLWPRRTVRGRYTLLQRVLLQGMDAQLRGLGQVFSGPSAKMQYLIREHRLRETEAGQRLASAANEARSRMRERERLTDDALELAQPYDLKAVCLFLAAIYGGAGVPGALRTLFPDGWRDETTHRRARDREGHAIDCLRCTVDAWDDRHIFATTAEGDRQLTIDYATQDKQSPCDRRYLQALLSAGAQLNVIRPREKDNVLYPELLILHPDSLISVTAVAGCFQPCGTSPYWELINKIKPRSMTQPILLGFLAGQFLDEAAYGRTTTYQESVVRFFHRNALDIAACEQLGADFHEEAMRQQDNINRTMASTLHLHDGSGLRAEDMILEPSFFCETLGLQGRMDFIHLNMDTIVEQKSGKGAYGSSTDRPKQQQAHYVQLLLYRAIFHYAYAHKPYDEMSASLFYSKYAQGLLELGSAPALLFEAVKIRNQLAWLEIHCAEHGFGFLPTLTPEMICPMASGRLWEGWTKPDLQRVLAPMRTATPLERAYVLRFLRFVANEHVLDKFGNYTKEQSGFATLWNCSVEEKRQAGSLYEQLVLEAMDDNPEQEELIFHFSTEVDADTTNFRQGDIVICYPYAPGEEPDATAVAVFRSRLTDIRREGITVMLRNPQNARVFDNYRGKVWAVEHDFMEASYGTRYQAVYSFLSATPARRALILGQRPPVTHAPEPAAVDSEFARLVSRVAAADDLYLIIGPPGTGKTSFGMLNVLKEQLSHPGTNVLLLAFTNRAVDEMCSKLIKEDIDFIRLGNATNCSEECRPHLLDARVSIYNKVDDVRAAILGTRIFCGTAASLNACYQLFQLKAFDLAIVDEASQLLEPDLLGLLSAHHGDTDAVRKFVLIGDEKQLPAVVQQDESVSRVTEPELRAIGLTDCRLSLFERLLHLHGGVGESFCHLLTRQGRMHVDIQDFPSRAFYGGALQPVPLPHQQEASAVRRVLFIDCPETDERDESDKVNRAEAQVIARVVLQALAETTEEHPSIGIIVPYRNQISTVRSALSKLLASNSPLHTSHFTIDTVERYQGSERDLIVYGFTAKHPYQLDFLSANDYVTADDTIIDRKLNVAMTRARKRLVLVGNARLLARDPVFARLIDYCQANGCYLSTRT